MVFRHSMSPLLLAPLLLLCSSPSFLAQAFNAPLLSSVITPSLDTCSKDPAGWVKAPVTSVAQDAAVSKILTAQHNASFLWGTYQPNQYFAVKSRTAPATVASGILWHGPGRRLADARSECKQEDKIKKYGWTQHDGRRYGRQVIEDEMQEVKLVTEYVREEKKEKGEDVLTYWATRIQVTPTTKQGAEKNVKDEEEDEDDGEDDQQRALQRQQQREQAVVYLYLAIDCDGAVSADECLSVAGGEEGMQLLMDRNKDVGAAYIHGKTKDLGAFTLEVGMSGKAAALGSSSPLSISYWGGPRVMLADLKDKLEEDARRRMLMTRSGGEDLESLVGAPRRNAAGASGGSSCEILPDTVSDYSNVMVIRIAGAGPFQVDARLRAATPPDEDEDEEDEPAARSDVAKLKAMLDDATARGMQGFQDRFSQVFQLEKHGYKGRKFTPAEVEAAQAAFSNMIGGVGYFHGRTPIKGEKKEEVLASFPTSLFSAVPSRSFFPRGFLWDEGFHHLLLHKWDLGLTYDVLLHWLSHMHAHADCPEVGWIPREIALGEQARRRIPAEFLPQDVRVANPPTFLLTLEKVLGLVAAGGDDAEEEEGAQQQQCTESGIPLQHRQEFLQAIQDRLEKWVRWLITSQRGVVTGTFNWRGRGDPAEKLMATTFASGLDDYPRASEPGPTERHVDMLCWVIKGCQILSKLAAASGTAGSEETSKKYAGLGEELVGALVVFHWNETLGGHGGGFFDYGIHSEEGFIGETYAIRCGNPQKKVALDTRVERSVLEQWDPENGGTLESPCPPDFPVVVGMISREATRAYVRGLDLGPQHVPRVGYVSLFPLLLGLLPADSPRLGPLLKTLRDPEQLWSPYGIRSLSAADPYYQEENAPGDAPYWRGYIWININYLALRALWQLSRVEGPYQAIATETYSSLRENLLSTILGQYAKTGYFWEQYNDVTGEGMRCHPFTGWTALVVNVMAEDY